MAKSKEYYEGVAAATTAEEAPKCPYPRGSDKWMDWTNGFVRQSELDLAEQHDGLSPDEMEELLGDNEELENED